MRILLTGGTGYIGSHTAVELLQVGHEVVIIDNLYNSKKTVLERIEKITGKRPKFYEGDILDTKLLTKLLTEEKIEAVIHFAGLKAVGESVAKPLFYYKNNIAGTISLCEAMIESKVRNLVFSSSSTVYGDPAEVPIKETFPTGGTTNPYGTSKYVIELILKDWQKANPQQNIALLRYFNPVGAHKSGLIGEDPNGIPNNLMP
ncbi:MAG: NAD-dependent epimerase/dehydratase family protein, partial [Candidatus Riflebacteria bacterium]|nr:NAD-dependent epimerase/dehydratase family protein [Candidatus Riflebacteria bacterium]